MLIWGSKGKTKIAGKGTFMCPTCNSLQQYKHHVAGKYFTLYFIPIVKTKTLGEYIECQSCFMTYKPEVLDYGRGIAQAHKEINELVGMIKDKLESAIPLQYMLQALKEEGIPDREAGRLLIEATQNRMKRCPECTATYIASIIFCPACGVRLTNYSI